MGAVDWIHLAGSGQHNNKPSGCIEGVNCLTG